MSWYTTYKLASPYSNNMCPHCHECFNIDLFWEKGLKTQQAVGKCPYCKKPFIIQETDKVVQIPDESRWLPEEMMNFRYSLLKKINNQEFYRLIKDELFPELLVAPDTDKQCLDY